MEQLFQFVAVLILTSWRPNICIKYTGYKFDTLVGVGKFPQLPSSRNFEMPKFPGIRETMTFTAAGRGGVRRWSSSSW